MQFDVAFDHRESQADAVGLPAGGGAGAAVTVIRPRSVYFTALCSRLIRIWRSIVSSARTVAAPSTSTVMTSPFDRAKCSTFCRACSTTAATSTSARCG